MKDNIQEKISGTEDLLQHLKENNNSSLTKDLISFYEGQLVAYREILDML